MLKKGILIILIAVFCFSAFKIYEIISANQQEKQEHDKLLEYVEVVEDEQVEDTFELNVDQDSLLAVNPDYAGYIYIPNTDINYPIVQGLDNYYYLNHTFEKQYNYAGAIFMDYRLNKDFNNYQTLIYGHKVNHGTMFTDLNKFEDETFFNANPSFYINIDGVSHEVEISSFSLVPSDNSIYNLSLSDENQLLSYYNDVRSNAMYTNDVSLNSGDRLISLSTCAYDANSDMRYVLQGIIRSK